jgi:hypothetical protein
MLFPLPTLGVLKITGQGATALLQGQLTCEIKNISSTQGSLGAHCNPQGRVISLFYLSFLHDAYYLFMPHEMLLTATTALKKYAVFYQVQFTDASDQYKVAGIVGAQHCFLSPEKIALMTIPLPTNLSRQLIAGETQIMQQLIAQSATRCTAASIAVVDSAPRLSSASLEQPIQSDWKLLDIKERIPTIYQATSGKFLPNELNLPALSAVSFEKGCYTGQEIIARMHYRGKGKSHLYQATLHCQLMPSIGATIYFNQENQQKIAGTLIDVCQQSGSIYACLIIIEDAQAKNNHLFLDNNMQSFFIIYL